MLFNPLKYVRQARYFKSVYWTTGVASFYPALVWIFFILKGYFRVGHLPVYGDAEVVSFEGFDRHLVLSGLLVFELSFVIWFLMTLSNLLRKLRIVTWKNMIIGLIGSGLTVLVIISPQFEWLLD